MPGIAEAIEAARPRGGARLLVPQVLATMPEDLQRLALQLLASEHSDRFVAEAFSDDGYEVSANSVRNYRRANHLHRFNT